MTPRALVWLRRDLRLRDHSPLAWAESEGWATALAFVFDQKILGPLPATDRRVSFIHASLEEISGELRERGSALVTRVGDPAKEIPALAKALGVQAVVAGRDYEPYAKARDAKVEKALAALGIKFVLVKDQVIFEGREILSGAGTPYQVFTPYKRAWLAALGGEQFEKRGVKLPELLPQKILAPQIHRADLATLGFREQKLRLAPGSKAAGKRLEKFENRMGAYREARNFPAVEGSSGLSTHLRFGTLSIRGCVRAALAQKNPGAETWLAELAWRDFFQMVLDQFPRVGQGLTFRPEYEAIQWPGREEHFAAWVEGRTGFPLIDAAMREFRATGWMHNRLRMVTASFFVKDLLLDWRRGEEVFAKGLLDFDLAANNGGWQWSASTGCDAQPYFRVFNPYSQSRKFDPTGEYLRAHLPELVRLGNKEIHEPGAATAYPAPLVNHARQRERALALYASCRAARGSGV